MAKLKTKLTSINRLRYYRRRLPMVGDPPFVRSWRDWGEQISALYYIAKQAKKSPPLTGLWYHL